MEHNETISQGLANLKAIKDNQDPECFDRGTDALSLAIEEVDLAYDDHDLERYVPRERVYAATARWRRRNGYCYYDRRLTGRKRRFDKKITALQRATESHVIGINEQIIEDSGIEEFTDTVRHELAHVMAYVDSSCGPHGTSPGHGDGWKRWARKLGADPSRCHHKKEIEYEYWYGCPEGCWESGRHIRSGKVKKPFKRVCTKCRATCVSWDDGDERPTKGGTVAVESIPWNNRNEWEYHR